MWSFRLIGQYLCTTLPPDGATVYEILKWLYFFYHLLFIFYHIFSKLGAKVCFVPRNNPQQCCTRPSAQPDTWMCWSAPNILKWWPIKQRFFQFPVTALSHSRCLLSLKLDNPQLLLTFLLGKTSLTSETLLSNTRLFLFSSHWSRYLRKSEVIGPLSTETTGTNTPSTLITVTPTVRSASL